MLPLQCRAVCSRFHGSQEGHAENVLGDLIKNARQVFPPLENETTPFIERQCTVVGREKLELDPRETGPMCLLDGHLKKLPTQAPITKRREQSHPKSTCVAEALLVDGRHVTPPDNLRVAFRDEINGTRRKRRAYRTEERGFDERKPSLSNCSIDAAPDAFYVFEGPSSYSNVECLIVRGFFSDHVRNR